MLHDDSILMEEPSFLILNKPSGTLTQAAAGVESIETLLRDLLSRRSGNDHTPFVGLPHRLDRGTSGCLLIARNERSLKRFGEQFQSRKIKKIYHAIVHGHLEQLEGVWRDYVRKIPERPVGEIVAAEHPEGKLASLRYRSLRQNDLGTLVEIELETGRMHQIRIQFAARGCPILGDWCYGSQSTWGELDARGQRSSIALHARSIEFRHPMNAKVTSVIAPYPERWSAEAPGLIDQRGTIAE